MRDSDRERIVESRLEFGPAEIALTNPQRFEMSLLSGVIAFRPADGLIVGVKLIAPDEFWVRGYSPTEPVFPPVLLIEVAGQLCSFYWCKTHPADRRTFALSQIKTVEFHAPVSVGDRLVVVGKAVDLNLRRAEFDVAGFVADQCIFEATIVGMALPSPA